MITLPQPVRLFYNQNSGLYTCIVTYGANHRVYRFPIPPYKQSSFIKIYEGTLPLSEIIRPDFGDEKYQLEKYEGQVSNVIQTCMRITSINDNKIPLEKAEPVAISIVEQLKLVCHKAEVAGSIRRQKSFVKDIEIVCVPKQQVDGTDYTYMPHRNFVNIVNHWQKIKGEPTGKYTQRIIPVEGGIKLDLFIACPANFGLIMIYRTGSAEFNIVWMAHARRMGYTMKDGFMWKGNERIDIRTEQAFFRTLNIEYMEPRDRTENCKLRYL